MSEPDSEPLHVQVARALGVKKHYALHPVYPYKIEGPRFLRLRETWDEARERLIHDGEFEWSGDFPRYDTDWSATGPLIEKYGIAIENRPDNEPEYQWIAAAEPICADHNHSVPDIFGHAPTPLLAVCNLILALHKEGKLKAE